MTKPRHVVRSSLEERRRFVHQHSSRKHKQVGEVVGGTTAEMAAVCCCVPIAVVDFVVLTMYKVPAGLCRNAMRRNKSQRSLVMKRSDSVSSIGSVGDSELSMHPAVIAAAERFMKPEVDKDALAMDNEMWEKFHEGGFWRSPSRRLG